MAARNNGVPFSTAKLIVRPSACTSTVNVKVPSRLAARAIAGYWGSGARIASRRVQSFAERVRSDHTHASRTTSELSDGQPGIPFDRHVKEALLPVRHVWCYTLCAMAEGPQTLTPDTQFFRDVFNASPIGIVVENLEGQPLFVNPAFCSMLGFSEEELCGKHWVQFSPPEDAEKDWGLFQQLRAGSIDQQLHENSVILPEVRSRLGEFEKQILEIATDIQSLSHELHSAKLQYLGIAAAMRGFCREFAEQQKVEIDFKAHDLPSPLSPDISLCLFRVLQEALHNSAKHSAVRQFEVRLWGTSDEIRLTVKDSGVGFDREPAKESRGLGLMSMEERLKLVKGTLSINSQPKRGTTIHARVPLSSGGDSMRAAG